MGKQAMGVYIVLLLYLYRKMGQWLCNNSGTDMSIYTKKENTSMSMPSPDTINIVNLLVEALCYYLLYLLLFYAVLIFPFFVNF